MAFARIRSLRGNRRRSSTPTPSVASPPETTSDKVVKSEGKMEDTAVEDLPIKEITINLTQNDTENDNTDQPSYESWNISNIPTCNCGLTAANGILCFTDGLCGIVPPPVEDQEMEKKKRPQSPFFLKVPKVDPNKSGFVTLPRKKGDDCSISSAVSEIVKEEVDVQQQQQQQQQQPPKQQVDKVQEPNEIKRNNDLNGEVQSLHLQVGPLKTSKEKSCSTDDQRTSLQFEQSTEHGNKSEQIFKPKSSAELIRLPMRAGRSRLRDKSAENLDGAKPVQGMSIPTQTKTLPRANRARITRLPVRAGRTDKAKQINALDTVKSDRNSRRSLAERRRCLIATTKKEVPIIPQPADDKSCIDYFPLIHISHDLSFDNDEEIEATMADSITLYHAEVSKSKMCRGESNATKGTLDYTTASSHETLEETFEETFEYSSEEDSTLVFDKIGAADDRITKAGWITRQLYKDCRRDKVDGATNVELVYTLD